MQIFDAVATRGALDFETLIPRLWESHIKGDRASQRHSCTFNADHDHKGSAPIIAAWEESGYRGFKAVNVSAGNSQRGLSNQHSTYVLYDARTGQPLAQMDASEVTSYRAAAASALAASYLARRNASRLVIVGACRIGRLVPQAYRTLLPIRHVEIWDANHDAVAALVEHLTTLGFLATPVVNLRGSIGRADVVSCGTPMSEPIVPGRWLAPGSHLDLIGNFVPQMHETDDDCLRDVALFVDTDDAHHAIGETGGLVRNVASFVGVKGTLADLCYGKVRGRASATQLTVFKSAGTALEDLAAAIQVYENSVCH